MLYSADMNHPVLPEAVRPGRHYSLKADLRLNAWAFVAVAVAFVARWYLKDHPNGSAWLRAGVALTPLLPSLLYVRSIAGWIRGMDELQRRIQLEACLFATTGTVFVATALGLMDGAGVLATARLQHGLGWEGTFASILLLYVLGNVIFNRQYR